MKKLISIVAVLGLSACMGGGGSDDVDVPVVAPEVLMNQDFQSQLNDARMMNSLSTLTYDTKLIKTANDFSVEKLAREAVMDNSVPDVGDIATGNGYAWEVIRVASADGNYDNGTVLAFWQNDFFGQQVLDFDDMDNPLRDFGIAKVSNGSTDRWALVVAAPK